MDMVILGFGRVVLEVVDYLLGVDLGRRYQSNITRGLKEQFRLHHGEAEDSVSIRILTWRARDMMTIELAKSF